MKTNIDSTNKGEIILYQLDDNIRLGVRMEGETVWLNRQQMALLFNRDVKTIGKHIQNALREELKNLSVVAKFATTANDGKTYQVEHYNLDMVLSVGYRVKSSRGVEFRRWANTILKNYLLCGYAVNQRFERLEQRVTKTEEQIDFFVRTALPPVEVCTSDRFHDRFLILDDTVYHLGASLKDLGKKLFAFSRMKVRADLLLNP